MYISQESNELRQTNYSQNDIQEKPMECIDNEEKEMECIDNEENPMECIDNTSSTPSDTHSCSAFKPLTSDEGDICAAFRTEGEVQNEKLIGVIDAGTRTVKFCVFKSQHSVELVEHAVDITTKTPNEGWHEQNPIEILNAIKICIQHVSHQIERLGNSFS